MMPEPIRDAERGSCGWLRLSHDDDRPVLRRLSEHFELCAFGLAQVRKELDKLEAEGAARPAGRTPSACASTAGTGAPEAPDTCRIVER